MIDHTIPRYTREELNKAFEAGWKARGEVEAHNRKQSNTEDFLHSEDTQGWNDFAQMRAMPSH